MNQVQSQNLQKQMKEIHVNADRHVSPILTDRGISQKVDSIMYKDDKNHSDQKHYSNNPPPKYQHNRPGETTSQLKF